MVDVFRICLNNRPVLIPALKNYSLTLRSVALWEFQVARKHQLLRSSSALDNRGLYSHVWGWEYNGVLLHQLQRKPSALARES